MPTSTRTHPMRAGLTHVKEGGMHHGAYILTVVAVCACGDAAQITPPSGTESAELSAWHDRGRLRVYDVEKLPTLGGRANRGNSINDRGWVAGYVSLPDNSARHAALWRDGSLTDLGTLGGPNSSVAWPGQNDRGTVVGIAETADIDPLHEDWSCSGFLPAAIHHVCLGFVYEGGGMRPLPTFPGGVNGFATGVNDRGNIVGWAENDVHDPTCKGNQIRQFRAALWDSRTRAIHQLPPLRGDSTSAATAINARGQVVGISGECDVAIGEFSAQHAVLWEDGHPTLIRTLGGIAWNTPMDINDAGDVVGFANLGNDVDGAYNPHAFFWTRRGGPRDLGALPGDTNSTAMGINSERQIAGQSCGAVVCRAVIWEHGRIYNLNGLMAAGFTDSLVSAQDINEEGAITGRLVEAGTGRLLAFVATPRRERH
ncbi:MAG: hypothetical protein H0X34_14770 [Chthoniobacterales bacterium]|nr:hypothetical protein [Chthoniobacterales bacterium]